MMKAPLVGLVAVLAIAGSSQTSLAANCEAADVTGMSVSFSPATPTYTAVAGATTTASVSVTTTTGANCTNLSFGFTAASGTITGPSANTLAFTIASPPLTSSPENLGSISGTGIVIGSYTTTITAGQNKPAGSYSMPMTPNVEVVLYAKPPSLPAVDIRRATFGLQAQVTGTCSLSSGTAASASVSFTGHITNGVPSATVKQHSLNVDCTVPAKVRLSGSAMTTATPANAAFDNFINYRAVATFSGATTTLTTNGTTPVISTSTGFSATTGTNIPVTIDINMIAGSKPLLAGSYSNVMTVTVDPNL